jgi:hypothetical protein
MNISEQGERQMDKKKWGIVLLIVGVALLILSLGADMFGLGTVAGFGYKQIAGSIAGIIIAVIGYILAFRK